MTGPGRRTRLESLTGVRAALSILVVLTHARIASGPDGQRAAGWIVAGGSPLVSSFFMLSGIVLAWTWAPRGGLWPYFRRRAARILPNYYLALVLATIIFRITAHRWPSPSVFLVNVVLLQDWFPANRWIAVNGPAWSLSAEVFCYVVFPFLVVRLSRLTSRQRRWLVVGFLCLAVMGQIIATTASSPDLFPSAAPDSRRVWIGRSPVLRMMEFSAGVCAGLELRDGWRPKVSLNWAVVLNIVVFLLSAQMRTTWIQFALEVPAFFVLLLGCVESDRSGGPGYFRNKVVVRLGAASYFFYLIHIPVLTLVVTQVDGIYRHVFLDFLLVVSVSMIGALLAHRWVEVPANRLLRGDHRVATGLDVGPRTAGQGE